MEKATNRVFMAFCLVLILQSTLIVAQTRTITGTIYNGITSKPIPEIVVRMKGVIESAKTDADGVYTLTIPDTMQTMSYIGFKDMDVMEIKTINQSEINIYLSEVNLPDFSLEELMKIKVVTASKQEQLVSDIPASVVVITRNDIEAYGYQSLKDILSNVLGMYKIDDYRNVSFGVRGFFTNVYNRNIIFMINGVVQQQPYQSWNDLNLMNLQVESIERVEVLRGPAAIIYGNDAFFGAINIITQHKDRNTKSSATTSYGTDNTYRGNIQINSASENTSMNISAGYYQTDGRNTPFKPMLDSVQRYDKTWVKNGTTKDYFSQNSSYLNISTEHKGFYTNLSYDETNRNLIHRWLPVYDTTKLSRNEFILRSDVGYRKEINSKFSFDFHINYELYFWTNNYEKGLVTPDIQYGNNKTETRKLNTELITFIKPIESMKVTLGLNYMYFPYATLLSDYPPLSDRSLVTLYTPLVSYSAYSQVEYAITPKLLILAGARAERQNKYDYENSVFLSGNHKDSIYTYNYNKISLTPRAAIVFKINSKNILKLMYSEAFSRPCLFENANLNWLPQQSLVPQTIATTEINYSSVLFNSLTYSINVFYNNLDNLINRRDVFMPNTNTYAVINDNSGRFETMGGEGQLIFKPFHYLKFDASFSYQKTTNKLFDIDASYSPRILTYLKAIYIIKKDIILGMNSYYVGSMESEWDEIKQQRISETTPGYVNLSMNIRFNNIFKSGLYCSLHANNLLDTEIHYAPTSVNRSYLPNGTYDAGIQLFATLGLKF